ncbi:aminoacyl-tRNA hydrolase [Spiroplasma endosymbiont of Labia minor]|uniref:aminoacyl-tRNA hydrolase n=1 Tax=Spiroplasma endosymbiont of Labia minor TaxID=3066305 RepID=UPI0030D3F725
MKLIVALGNIGKEYANTRHNAAWIIADELISNTDNVKTKQEFKGETHTFIINNEKIIILKPHTFMNLSGQSLVMCMQFYKLSLDDIIIIHDDKDFEFARLAIKLGGSHGGHNGLKNIIAEIGSEKFARLRIGIGTPENNYKIIDWVLSKMNTAEIQQLKNLSDTVLNIIKDWANNQNINNLMSKYNKNKRKEFQNE